MGAVAAGYLPSARCGSALPSAANGARGWPRSAATSLAWLGNLFLHLVHQYLT